MRVGGFITSDGQNVLHRSMLCPGIARSDSLVDASVWVWDDGTITRTRRNPERWAMCAHKMCVSEPPVDWDRALCREYPPAMFFPEGNAPDWGPAKAVCGDCPVQEDCLTYAVTLGLSYGMFGGATPNQRKEMRRTDGRAEAASSRVLAS